jgi:phage terminase small subunit
MAETVKRGRVTPKQQRFVDEYLVDLNATQAAIRAGYSKRTAKVQGSRLLTIADIQASIQESMRGRETRTHITQDRVLQELARIAFFDIRKLYRPDGGLKAMSELDDEAAAVLAGVDVVEMQGAMGVAAEGGVAHVPMYTKKAKIPDKVGALSLAMRHLGMLKDKTELSGPGGAPMLPPVIKLIRSA